MASRESLSAKLKTVPNVRKVYFQPPESVKMEYDCIRYSKSAPDIRRADNTIYKKQPLSYGYVVAKRASADKYFNNDTTNSIEYRDTNVNGVNTTNDFKFVTNVNCTSENGKFLKDSVVAKDHKNYDDYRIYSLVVTYIKKDGMTDADVAKKKGQDVVARPYLRYTDANGLYRTYYQDYTGTKVYGGCSTNYEATWDYLSGKNYFPTK